MRKQGRSVKMRDIRTQVLQNNPAGITAAAQLLAQGKLVAFATETVYGLGGDARQDTTVAQIYAAKGRPSFNPLIVHVPDLETAERYAIFDDAARALAHAFWPGALTLVLPIAPDAGLSKLVTAGLDTVAIRVPAHESARALLSEFGGPIAAPSANPSGRISPTTAEHVISGLNGKIAAVLDGGPCTVGLESTIIGTTDTVSLLRAGGIPASAIESCLGQTLAKAGETITAPGQMVSHYAPNGTIRLNADDAQEGETLLGFGAVDCDLNLSKPADLIEAAANLFKCLHELDAMKADKIAVSKIPMTGLGIAINDRLARAAAPRDR